MFSNIFYQLHIFGLIEDGTLLEVFNASEQLLRASTAMRDALHDAILRVPYEFTLRFCFFTRQLRRMDMASFAKAFSSDLASAYRLYSSKVWQGERALARERDRSDKFSSFLNVQQRSVAIEIDTLLRKPVRSNTCHYHYDHLFD